MEIETVISHPIFIFSIGMIAGFISGMVTQHFLCNRGHGESASKDVGAWIFIILISGLYSVSVIADIYSPEYSTPFALHGIMGLAAGYALEAKLSDIIPFIKK